jgi:hypothetical protein
MLAMAARMAAGWTRPRLMAVVMMPVRLAPVLAEILLVSMELPLVLADVAALGRRACRVAVLEILSQLAAVPPDVGSLVVDLRAVVADVAA